MPSPLPAPLPAPVVAAAPLASPPTYPAARPLGLLTVALAYFALGVAIGLVMRRSGAERRWLRMLIGPAVVAAIGYLAWVARSLT